MHEIQSVLCWSFKNDINSNNEKFYNSYNIQFKNIDL